MTERERQHAILVKLARSGGQPPACVPTGFAVLDRVVGGGLPRGCITEVFGNPAAGKTTLALNVVAHAQASGLMAAWIDAESSFDPVYARLCGVDMERLPVARPSNAEESIEIARKLILCGAIDVLALDCAAALMPALELEIGLGDGPAGLQSRVLTSGFRHLGFAAAKTKTAVLVLNQVRSRAGADDGETTAGGPALKMHAALRLSIEPSRTPACVHFRVLKSKMAHAFQAGELRFTNRAEPTKTP